MTEDTSDVAWLDQHQQRSWRAFLVGTTLLMDRLDRDLREQHRIVPAGVRDPGPARRGRRATGCGWRCSPTRSATPAPGSRTPSPGWRPAGLVARDACVSDGRGVEAVLTDAGPCGAGERPPRPTWPGVRQFLVDLVDDDDFDAVGRVFDAVTDKLIEANPAVDIR